MAASAFGSGTPSHRVERIALPTSSSTASASADIKKAARKGSQPFRSHRPLGVTTPATPPISRDSAKSVFSPPGGVRSSVATIPGTTFKNSRRFATAQTAATIREGDIVRESLFFAGPATR